MPEWLRRPAPGTFLLVAGLVCVVYGRALDAPFIFDDTPAILENASIRRLWPLVGSRATPGPLRPPHLGPTARRPLANLTFALDHRLAGRDPRWYRIVNVALHVLAATLVAALVRRTLRLPYFGGAWDRVATPLAAVAAVVWALHPLVTEAVVYVTQRTELLMAVCWLATLWAALRYWTTPEGSARAGWVALAGVACAAGMASKEVMASVPLVVLLFERTFLAPSVRAALRRSWPLYAALLLGWVVLLALNVWSVRGVTSDARHAVPLHVWWWTQAKVSWLYLRLVVWPWPLSIYYAPRYLPTFAAAAPWLAAGTAMVVAIAVAVRRRPAVRFVVAAMALTLAPTMVVPIVKMMAAERRLYLPLAGIVVLAVVGTWRGLVARRPAGALRLGAALAAAIVLVEGAVSFHRLGAYDTAVGIWTDALRTQPDAALAHYNLGVALLEARRPEDAKAAFEETLRRDPDHTKARDNLGLALSQLGRPDEAIGHFEAALARDPSDAAALNNLAAALVRQGRAQDAVAHLDRALALQSEAPAAKIHVTYAKALLELGRPGDALDHLTRAVERDPDDADAQYSLGAALLAAGRPDAALPPLEAAVRLAPEDPEAHNNLANALLRTGRAEAAAVAYRRALALRPDYAEAHNNLGAALLHVGAVDEGLRHLERALALKPDHANARYNLAGALLTAGRTGDAVVQYREAVRLTPDDARGRLELARALARDGQRTEAMAVAADGVALARAQNDTGLAGEIDAWVGANRSQAAGE